MLQSIYDQFTEGFGTADLIHAKALLEFVAPASKKNSRSGWDRLHEVNRPRDTKACQLPAPAGLGPA